MARRDPLPGIRLAVTHHALDRVDERLPAALRDALMDLRRGERLLRDFVAANLWYPSDGGGWIVIGSTHGVKLGVVVQVVPGQVTVLTLVTWPRTPGKGVQARDVLGSVG